MSRKLYEDELAFANFMISELKNLTKKMQEENSDKEYETSPFFDTVLVYHTPGDKVEPYGTFAVDKYENWSYIPT